ncbi:hypothetical protein ULMS_25750 [Patiriisocius marinistellae]|uniref:Uncharacterized protein n=1 Tax=Patiriisocius marinistellae TaxID=2494560 RepID=A0A5J4FWK3_9FLAO|nr:NRDE family protein [Patiriisocius marinistellae]GEQ87067.1 hypothetical protein ULMS_25750 [Patiriisocius marinistellae]
MCTLTFIPTSFDNFVLTSNRDEAPGRATIAPQEYDENGTKLLFPKDELGGGTWIGVSEKKRLICLLNGGFTTHERAESYRMSRGIIVTDLLTSEILKTEIDSYNFKGIEPFTIIAVDWAKELHLYELVWDGKESHFSEKPLAPHIWSSSLLYTPTVKKQRELWFSNFLFKEVRPTNTQILNFHKTAGIGDVVNDIVMDRGFVKTKSITQISKSEDTINMYYEDLQSQKITKTTF